MLTGARATVLFGLGATALGVLAGGLIGLLAGVAAGSVDAVIMRVLDGLIAVPDLLFALLIVTVLGNSMGNALLAVAIAFTPGLARITRSTVLSLRSRDYVLAAVARGEGRRHPRPGAPAGRVFALADAVARPGWRRRDLREMDRAWRRDIC